jgi:hypothetical protein
VVRAELPGKSIKGIRRLIDALRLVSNFYIAIFICTFISKSHIAENMTTITRSGNLVRVCTPFLGLSSALVLIVVLRLTGPFSGAL